MISPYVFHSIARCYSRPELNRTTTVGMNKMFVKFSSGRRHLDICLETFASLCICNICFEMCPGVYTCAGLVPGQRCLETAVWDQWKFYCLSSHLQ